MFCTLKELISLAHVGRAFFLGIEEKEPLLQIQAIIIQKALPLFLILILDQNLK